MCPAFPQYRQSHGPPVIAATDPAAWAHLPLVAESGGHEKVGEVEWEWTLGWRRLARQGVYRAEFPECWARSRRRSRSLSSMRRARVTRLLNKEGRSRTRRSFISSDSPLRYALRSALSSHLLSAARVWNSRVYSAMLRDPCKMLCSRPAALAPFEGWSNVFLSRAWEVEDWVPPGGPRAPPGGQQGMMQPDEQEEGRGWARSQEIVVAANHVREPPGHLVGQGGEGGGGGDRGGLKFSHLPGHLGECGRELRVQFG